MSFIAIGVRPAGIPAVFGCITTLHPFPPGSPFSPALCDAHRAQNGTGGTEYRPLEAHCLVILKVARDKGCDAKAKRVDPHKCQGGKADFASLHFDSPKSLFPVRVGGHQND